MSEEKTGIKFDDDKDRWDLIPLGPIQQIVKVMTYGSSKYGDNQWQNLDNFNDRYFGACMRHLVAWRNGENSDPESGLSHLAHAACNLVFLMWRKDELRSNIKDAFNKALEGK